MAKKRIGLVGCSGRKLKEAKMNPQKYFPAKDIYTGKSFRKSVQEGLEYFGCDSYFILSGKMEHVLLNPEDPIQYYDCYLAEQKTDYRKEWASKVLTKLESKLGDLDDYEFVVFAGKVYYENLVGRLNFKTLIFVHRQITFEVKDEFRRNICQN